MARLSSKLKVAFLGTLLAVGKALVKFAITRRLEDDPDLLVRYAEILEVEDLGNAGEPWRISAIAKKLGRLARKACYQAGDLIVLRRRIEILEDALMHHLAHDHNTLPGDDANYTLLFVDKSRYVPKR